MWPQTPGLHWYFLREVFFSLLYVPYKLISLVSECLELQIIIPDMSIVYSYTLKREQ